MNTPASSLARSALASCALLLGCSAPVHQVEIPYSFSEPPYVHPKVVEDLGTWLCDGGDQVIAVNLLDSQDSNRYHGKIQVNDVVGESPFVYVREEGTMFGYRYVGTTASGIDVLYTSDCGGGSGVFVNLLLVRWEEDRGIDCDWDGLAVRPGRRRLALRKVGEIALGDRWSGKLRVDGNELFVGKDEGPFAGRNGGGMVSEVPKDRVLKIDPAAGAMPR